MADLQAAKDLAKELEELTSSFHAKSDQHTILQYESARILAVVAFHETGTPIPGNLRESPLLGKWGSSYNSSDWLGIQNKVSQCYADIDPTYS